MLESKSLQKCGQNHNLVSSKGIYWQAQQQQKAQQDN